MKTKIRLLILAIFTISANISVFAADFTVDGLSYCVNSFTTMTCRVVGCNSTITDLVIPESVTYKDRVFKVVQIAESAFYNHSSLTSVSIPNSVRTINSFAFNGCSSLKTVSMPNDVTLYGAGFFEDCKSLLSIKLPENCTSIANNTFKGCTSLESIIIPSNVTRIGNSAFAYCSSLKSITIPRSVTTIDEWAFKDCSSLQSITFLPNGYVDIDTDAFDRCYPKALFTNWSSLPCDECQGSLIELTLLEDFKGYTSNLTENLYNLKRLISLPETPPSSPALSNKQIMELEVLVPTSALPLYQQAPGWKDLWNLKGGAETATGIENVTVPSKEKKSCIYNINGMKVEHTVPGEIYIKDGKKFIAR